MRSIFILCFLIEALNVALGHLCPAPCTCKLVGPQAERLRVKCNKEIEDIKEININLVSVELYHLDISKNNIYVIEAEIFKNLTNLRRLDISNNKITALGEGSFNGLGNLERLDLSKNQISFIDPLAFRQLVNLKKLDLSTNKLSTVAPTLFHDLLALERLKLNGNTLKTLSEGSFHGLKLLRQLDLSNNPWKCDCYIYWLSNWKNTSLFKLSPVPTCDSPPNFHGQSLIDLRLSEEFQCEWTSPVIEIRPVQNQVVFAGDSITLKCSAPSITDDRSAKLYWLWNPSPIINTTDLQTTFTDPQNILSNIKIENRHLSDSGIIDSSLNIFPVKEEHNGLWNCHLVSVYGNKTKAIGIIVISDDTKYCPLTMTRNNKGTYAWPRTIIGWKVELPCEGIGLSSLSPIPLRASYQCNSTGNWTNLNTDACPFISPITKALEQYSKVNLSLTKGNLLETAKRFHNHTADPKKITDPIEIHFITKTVENYLNFLADETELGTMLIDIISSIMNLSKNMLKIAEINYNACTRLIKAVEIITEMTPTIQVHKVNFILEEFRINRESYSGIVCTWRKSISPNDNIDKNPLYCATNNLIVRSNDRDHPIEASIKLPASLLRNLDSSTASYSVMISMYNDNNLFPPIKNDKKFEIISGVIGSKIFGNPSPDIGERISIILKIPHHFNIASLPRPVMWSTQFNKSGNWTTNGCNETNYYGNLVAFSCYSFGYYGLIEDTTYSKLREHVGAKFRYSNPAIYIGTFITIICLVCTSVTYIICYTSIIMPKRAKHSVINTWIAITLLCFLYTVGIHQTENYKLCQDVGLVLHYLSLCCLLWMAVSVSNMYKRLVKSDITAVPDDEIQEPPIQKPILGLYLVGWGIALIVCGISGAINLQEYASYSYCFLTSGPALAALFVPAVILTFYLIIFYLMVRCTIRSADVNGQLSEGTQATENMDLELLEPHENRVDQNSIHSTQTVSSEVEDIEHSQITQLKGHIVTLILYMMMWCSGAAATAQPFSPNIPHEETLFAIIYAITASSLGLFVLLFYGIARSDVRSQWTLMRCWLRRKKNRCCRTRSVSDANPSMPAQPLVQNVPPPISNSQATQVISDTNSINSSRPTSISRTCHTLKASDNACDTLPTASSKIPNVNLVVLHRQQYRSNNSVTTYTDAAPSACVEMFYNPHQSGVARKFFKKQRRHTKNNNLGPRKQGDGGVTSDGGSCISIPRPAPKIIEEIDSMETSMFGSSAKVNNTNIHVEKNPINDTKNINILSDSGGSMSEERNIPVRYVIGEDNLLRNANKKVNNDLPRSELRRVAEVQTNSATMSPIESDFEVRTDEEKHLRNVSQQCSLEYSSELDSANQMISERSDHNLPEIGETPETPEKLINNDFRCSSLNEINQEIQLNPQRNVERSSEHSSSLYCLSTDQFPPPPLRTSYRSSFNDVTSVAASSKICEADSRASIDDLPSEESSDINSRFQRNSQRSLTDENSMTSEVTYTRDLPLFTGSLSNINRISVHSCHSNDGPFQILDDLTLPNLTVDVNLINRPTNLPYLDKEFNSLTDLTSIDVTLGATRHLDMNASIGVDYEDTNYINSEPYVDDAALDDEVLLDSNSMKKETSV
ncbi:hypothetical protein PV328_010066 [Microctonus aethiopoides]|uniref:Adhesion G protein-coupled receptor A3 n=1 Tax=Microctonus aethiopoides TaxID=144406 RepID=A0AA39C743_9HYME|nr:hypothetical protein PV328_010066 [Microctonus aethiopoides]